MKIRWVAVLALALGGNAWASEHGCEEGRPHTHWWLEFSLPEHVWYAGAAFGQTSFSDWEAQFLDDGSFTSASSDDSDTGWRLFGGADFGRYLSVELGYSDFGEAAFAAQSDGSGSVWNAGPVHDSVALDGFDLTFIGKLPVGEDFALFAKAGTLQLSSSVRFDGDQQCCTSNTFRHTSQDTRLLYGGGVQYDGFRPLRVVAEYGTASFRSDPIIDDGQFGSIGISLAYLFQ